ITASQAVFSVVTGGAFQTLGIPIVSGRDFNPSDTYEAPFTAIINESLARRSFPGQNPIGRVLYCGFDSMKPMTIVGVVGDIRQFGPAENGWPEIYMPHQQHPVSSMYLIARTAGD